MEVKPKRDLKGRVLKGYNCMAGRKHSEASKQRMRLAALGRKASEETRQKMSLAFKGRKLSEEHKEKIGSAVLGKNNGLWKGDKVGRYTLHEWVRRHLPAPKLCQMCNLKPHKDLANMTGIYNREFKNWAYLCRSCHCKYDGHINNIKRMRWGLRRVETS